MLQYISTKRLNSLKCPLIAFHFCPMTGIHEMKKNTIAQSRNFTFWRVNSDRTTERIHLSLGNSRLASPFKLFASVFYSRPTVIGEVGWRFVCLKLNRTF